MKEKRAPQLTGWWLLVTAALIVTLNGCVGLVGSNGQGNKGSQGINQVNHVIFMAQENRGFDHYFGAMRQYWAANNIQDQSFDGLPQFNPASGSAPLQGPVPTNPGCDPAFPPPSDCTENSNSEVESFSDGLPNAVAD